MIGRDPRGLEVAYRRYAGPLFAYSRGLLADPHAAADVVHDTFVLASSRVRQLRDHDLLRPWLYAIARNECRRAVRARRRTATLDLAGDPPAEEPDPEAATQAGELVRAAVASLGRGDRTVIELALRHHLSAVDVGAALGIDTNHAHARLSRARAQFERALDALLIARARAADCPALRQVLGEWHGRLTPLLRKRVNRHIDACDTCRPRGGRPGQMRYRWMVGASQATASSRSRATIGGSFST
jgi:RNA polymerase sigma factor (sigma-70 family)